MNKTQILKLITRISKKYKGIFAEMSYITSNFVAKDPNKGLSTNDLTDDLKTKILSKKVKDVGTSGHSVTFTYTDNTTKNIDLESLVKDVHIESGSFDKTNGVITLKDSDGNDITIDLSDFVSSSELAPIASKASSANSRSYRNENKISHIDIVSAKGTHGELYKDIDVVNKYGVVLVGDENYPAGIYECILDEVDDGTGNIYQEIKYKEDPILVFGGGNSGGGLEPKPFLRDSANRDIIDYLNNLDGVFEYVPQVDMGSDWDKYKKYKRYAGVWYETKLISWDGENTPNSINIFENIDNFKNHSVDKVFNFSELHEDLSDCIFNGVAENLKGNYKALLLSKNYKLYVVYIRQEYNSNDITNHTSNVISDKDYIELSVPYGIDLSERFLNPCIYDKTLVIDTDQKGIYTVNLEDSNPSLKKNMILLAGLDDSSADFDSWRSSFGYKLLNGGRILKWENTNSKNGMRDTYFVEKIQHLKNGKFGVPLTDQYMVKPPYYRSYDKLYNHKKISPHYTNIFELGKDILLTIYVNRQDFAKGRQNGSITAIVSDPITGRDNIVPININYSDYEEHPCYIGKFASLVSTDNNNKSAVITWGDYKDYGRPSITYVNYI